MNEWKPHLDREKYSIEDHSQYSITKNSEYGGWNTDSGYPGYGLPLELAQWICDILNEHGKNCPYIMDDYGNWGKKEN